MTDERWVGVPGYPSHWISDFGRVKTTKSYGNVGVERVLNQHILRGRGNKVGYYRVRLCVGKSRDSFSVARLILTAFVRPPREGEEANHKNGITTDDRLVNLEWVSRSENQKHAIRMGLAKIPDSTLALGKGKKYWWVHEEHGWCYQTPGEMGRMTNASPSPFFKMAGNPSYNTYKSFHGWAKSLNPPNPGSPAARDFSCSCPRMDNRNGLGVYDDENGKPLFWISGNCPIHGMELREEGTDNAKS